MDGAGLDLVERRRPGARQDTADHHRGSPRWCRSQGPEPQWPSPTRTWRGDEENRFAGDLRPLAQFWVALCSRRGRSRLEGGLLLPPPGGGGTARLRAV